LLRVSIIASVVIGKYTKSIKSLSMWRQSETYCTKSKKE